jgi:hypothetical protein
VEKTTYWGVQWYLLLTKYYSGDQIKNNQMSRPCSMWGRGEVHTRHLVEKPKWKRLLENPRHKWENSIKMDVQEVGRGAWTRLTQQWIGTGSRVLWMRLRTFGIHTMQGISWTYENLLASQGGLCSKKLFC